MGYVGTTGLSAIDYLIADRFHIPPAWDQHYRETVLRMPDGYLCYEPPAYAPAFGPLPALTTNRATFASFNNSTKITPQVVAVWAEILRRAPNSHLVLKCQWYDDAEVRRRQIERFAAAGIPAERLELLGKTSHLQQLEEYNRVDLALDTFPYSGGLTTCEACWMGVPVITCPCETFASRHSLSHLSNLRLTDTITRNLEEYVNKAVSLARDLPRLAALRAELRQRMAQSPLCDLDRFAAHFKAILRQAWHTWVRGQGAGVGNRNTAL
jgi:predicted O-linked N-acetylglucosamine transferase (SPINDLY family)